MSYFNHAFKKVFVATSDADGGALATVVSGIITDADVPVSDLKNPALGPGVIGFFDPETYLSLDPASLAAGGECCNFMIAGAAIKLNDKQGPYHGGYQEANKSKMINPKYLNKMWIAEQEAATQSMTSIGNMTVGAVEGCDGVFMCGETYYLRVDVKGTPALRFASHNLYRTLDASGGCCADPSAPVAIDPMIIYMGWAEQILEDSFFKDFILPILVVEGESYAPTQEIATALSLGAAHAYSDIPATTTASHVGMVLVGAYMDTKFGNCSFVTEDYYGVDPIQIYASEVDLNGDPCTFNGICVIHQCEGMKAIGTGEEKVRELILAESYLQNFMADDQRIREITQGTEAYTVLSRNSLYSSFYIQHVVPRFNNPSSTFDHDQYVLEIIGTPATITALEDYFTDYITAGCVGCAKIESWDRVECTFELPVIP